MANQKRWTVKVYDETGHHIETTHGVSAATRKMAKKKVAHGRWRPWMMEQFKMTASPKITEV